MQLFRIFRLCQRLKLKELPERCFGLTIPQIMNVMSALAFSILIGTCGNLDKSKDDHYYFR